MHRFLHQPLVGTNVVVLVGDEVDASTATSIDEAVLGEMARLEAMLTIFDDHSELARWVLGEVAQPSEDLTRVLDEALSWWQRSGGGFEPRIGVLSDLWRRASEGDETPDPDDIATVVARFSDPGFEITDGVPIVTGDLTGFQLHAFAKGWIVDAGLAVAVDVGGTDVDIVINAGGDLAHHGPRAQRIGIENPLRRFDNEPPILSIELQHQALATSGSARQGFEVGARRLSHVIDPRNGYPFDGYASISIVAADAATADVVATIAGIEPIDTALTVATSNGCGCAIVDHDGGVHTNDAWDRVSL